MLRDLRHAWRSILKMPVLAVVVVASLGVGIGVNTAVFSWVQAMFLQPVPGVSGAASIYLAEPRTENGTYPGASWAEYLDLRGRLRALPDLIAFRMAPLNVGEPGHVERSYGELVSANYFPALGLTPALGRFLRPEDGSKAGGEPVAVISYDYWQTHFSGAADVLGRTIRVNERPLAIIGVAPRGFKGTVLMLSFDMWVPATMAPALMAGSRELTDRSLRGYSLIGRLSRSTSAAEAQTELDQAMRDLSRAYPDSNAKIDGVLMPFWQAPRGPQRMLGNALLILQGLMLLLLLAVCGNTANLMLARASARQREVGTRLALGAGPGRIVSLLITESVVLAVLGAVLGAAIAVWATEAMRAVPIIGAFPIRFDTHIDAVGLAFAIGLGLCCGLLCGVVPALHLARVDPQAALRAGSRTAGRSPIRHALMAAQVGLALVVLMAAGLFLRSFGETRDADPGFKREGVLLAAYDLSVRNLDAGAARDFTARLLDRLSALPNVDAVAISSSVPLDIHGLPGRSFTVEGRAQPDGRPNRSLSNTVTPGYFAAMGIPMRAGQGLADLRDPKAPAQVVVNEAFVRRFIENGEALGRTVETRGARYVIAGIVRNSISESFGESPTPVIYFSYRDRPLSSGEIHLRTRAGAELLLAPQVERVVHDLDPMLPVYDVRTLSDHVEKNLVLRRIPARMFAVLGPALLIMAAIGIYAVVAYSVSQRTTEIGVRLALGATVSGVVAQIVAESMRVIVGGAVMGWISTLLVHMHLIRGPLHLSVFAGVPALLLLVAAIACWLPARRASGLDPVVALRQE